MLVTVFSHLKHTRCEAEKKVFVNAHIRAHDSDCLSRAASCLTLPSVPGDAGGAAGRSPVHGTSSMLNWWLFIPVMLFSSTSLFNQMVKRSVYCASMCHGSFLCAMSRYTHLAYLPFSMENFMFIDFSYYCIHSAEWICKVVVLPVGRWETREPGLGEVGKPALPTYLVMAGVNLTPGFSDSKPHALLRFPAASLTDLISNCSWLQGVGIHFSFDVSSNSLIQPLSEPLFEYSFPFLKCSA